MSVFETLNSINVNEHTEKKNELTYLSWSWAWAEVKKVYPDAEYSILKFNGLPYVFDEKTGYMVYTTVTIEGLTHEMWLPVMDGANNAMKAQSYTKKTRCKEITVEAATMFDINKTIMRCLTKNLAMFGLGLYIFAGEDLPENEETAKEQQNSGAESEPKEQTQTKTEQPPAIPCSVCNKPLTVEKANKIKAKYGAVICSKACAEKAGIEV